MKKIKKSYNEIWNERKRTIGSLLLLVVVVMFAVSGVRYLLNYIDFQNIKEIISAPAEEHKYPNLYNASRYFFRIYYPDGWMAEGGANGFFIDESTGLAAELYPLVFENRSINRYVFRNQIIELKKRR